MLAWCERAFVCTFTELSATGRVGQVLLPSDPTEKVNFLVAAAFSRSWWLWAVQLSKGTPALGVTMSKMGDVGIQHAPKP